ncbi:MAG: hypothetical protein Q7U60_01470 [Candidatus Methanoperedens sp.]|nr:hypothetical protein [Candidatus Methanoperedens sp.]
MYTLVFDANVPWDLDTINALNETMNLMNNINFKIYMSDINFNEMPVRVRTKLNNPQCVIIDETNTDEYDEFRKDIHRKDIMLDKKDSAVLFTSNKFNTEYIISSDTNVRRMTKKYADIYGKRITPFHLIDMFSFLRGINLIEPYSCIKMSLELYKKKEIPYMVERHGAELVSDEIKRNRWIKNETPTSVGCGTKLLNNPQI